MSDDGRQFPLLERKRRPSKKGVSLYLQIADQLRAEIDDGRLQPGDRLSSEPKLAEYYEVSRHTIREALGYLRSRGYLESRQGSGTVIKDRSKGRKINPVIGSLDDLAQYASETELDPTDVSISVPPEKISAALELAADVAVFYAGAMRRERNGKAFGYTRIYVPTEFATGLGRETICNVPIYTQIERNIGIEIAEVEQRIAAVSADDDTRNRLGLDAGDPVFRVWRVYYAEDGTPVEVAESFHYYGAYEYVIRLRKGT